MSKGRASSMVCAKSSVTMRRWPGWQRWLQQGRGEAGIVWWYFLHRICGVLWRRKEKPSEMTMRIKESAYLTCRGHDIWKVYMENYLLREQLASIRAIHWEIFRGENGDQENVGDDRHGLQRAEWKRWYLRYLSKIKGYIKHCREQEWSQRLRLLVVTELTRLWDKMVIIIIGGWEFELLNSLPWSARIMYMGGVAISTKGTCLIL